MGRFFRRRRAFGKRQAARRGVHGPARAQFRRLGRPRGRLVRSRRVRADHRRVARRVRRVPDRGPGRVLHRGSVAAGFGKRRGRRPRARLRRVPASRVHRPAARRALRRGGGRTRPGDQLHVPEPHLAQRQLAPHRDVPPRGRGVYEKRVHQLLALCHERRRDVRFGKFLARRFRRDARRLVNATQRDRRRLVRVGGRERASAAVARWPSRVDPGAVHRGERHRAADGVRVAGPVPGARLWLGARDVHEGERGGLGGSALRGR